MSTNCIILYNDQSDDAIFSGPVWTLPLTNMQDPRLTKVARSSDATAAKTQFYMALPNPIAIPGLVLIATNLDVNAQYRITAYSDAIFSIQTFTSGLNNVWLSSQAFVDPDFKGMPLIALFNQVVTAAYWQVEIINTANVAGYVEIGKIFMGGQLNQTYNFAPQSAFSRDPNTIVQRALAGTPYFSRHKNIRSWNLSFPNEKENVAWDEIDHLNEISGLDRPVFVIPDPDNTDRLYRQSFLGHLSKLSDIQLLNVAVASSGFQITEYIG